MGTIFDLTSAASSFSTGSWYPYANTAGQVSVTANEPEMTGSWGGLANTWGGIDMRTVSSSSLAVTGSWKGDAYSWGTKTTLSESNDRFALTSNSAPNVDQGVGPGLWDPFPTPQPPPAPPPPDRDVTRYRKTYSSQRMQPRPIRLVRG